MSRIPVQRSAPLPRVVRGFFTEHPELFRHLVAVPGLLTSRDVARYRNDPDRACAATNELLDTEAWNYRGNTEKGDDPHERLKPILKLDDPLAPVLDILGDMAQQRPNDRTMGATWLRNETLAHCCAQKGFRRGTLMALTCGQAAM